MARWTRLGVAIVAALVLLVLATAAHAQKKDSAEARRAKALFDQGIALSDEGKWSEALAVFQQSDELVPSASVEFNIAATLRALGRYVEARKTLQAILDLEPTMKPSMKPALKADVEKLLAEVTAKIVTLRLSLDPSDGTVEIDGAKASAGPDGTFELDPGRHVFVLSAKGHETTTITKTLAAADKELALKAPVIRTKVVEKRVEVPAEKSTPVYGRAWFWTAAGVLVAGAVVVTIIVTRPDERAPAAPPARTVDRVIPTAVRF